MYRKNTTTRTHMPSPAPKTVVSMETVKRNAKWVCQSINEFRESFNNDSSFYIWMLLEFPTTADSFERRSWRKFHVSGENWRTNYRVSVLFARSYLFEMFDNAKNDFQIIQRERNINEAQNFKDLENIQIRLFS